MGEQMLTEIIAKRKIIKSVPQVVDVRDFIQLFDK